MPLSRLWRRGACLGLALAVLVSSLTCMTIACRVVCAADAQAALKAAAADLPPCHRKAGAAESTGALPGPDGCGSGPVCCSTWIHDDESIHLAAPRLVREIVPGADMAFAPIALPALTGDPDMPFALDVGPDDARPLAAPCLAARGSRAPPAA